MSEFTPKAVMLEAGKEYYFCNCGKGKDQVFCDGSHKGTGKTPTKFTVKATQEYHLCTCKKSSNLPYCDGSHAK